MTHRWHRLQTRFGMVAFPDLIWNRKIDPGKVFDKTVGLNGVPEDYRAMANCESIKVMVQP